MLRFLALGEHRLGGLNGSYGWLGGEKRSATKKSLGPAVSPGVSAITSWMPGQTADADQEQLTVRKIRSIRPIRVPQNEEAHQAAFVRPDAVSSAIRNSDGVPRSGGSAM